MTTTRKHQRMPPTRSPVRAACDRCHETKSRCARAQGSFECERCSRLGNVCSYSAPLPMGRPKDKASTQCSGAPLRDHAHPYSQNAPIERKRQRRAAQKTSDAFQFGDNDERISPPASTSIASQANLTVIQIDDSQHLTCDSWLPDNWPTSNFDLSAMLEPDYAPQLDHRSTHPGAGFDHLQTPSSATLPVPETGHSTTDPEAVLSKPVGRNQDPAEMSGRSSTESPSDIHEDRLHQLLRLQSDLYKITSPAASSKISSFLQDDQIVHEKSVLMGQTSMSSLDTILGNTQTLIDILQTSPSSPSHVPRVPRNSTGASQVYPSSSNDIQSLSADDPSIPLDAVTTLLSLSCYSSLLVAYDGLIASLLSSDNQSDATIKQLPSVSPSLTFGSFSMTARSSLFVSTVIHLVREMVQQLQSTFRKTFSMPSNAKSEAIVPLDGHVRSNSQVDEVCGGFGNESSIVSSAHCVLMDISEREKRLLEILATRR
ncbi:hypothetical protein BKA64DRAFT_404391 [Cadophora sp. MPI-SDFR-AT-0126]|nr:hypothetical protein BKA64DRAFT_404391 [Leotiomycetes sp. MPI-SDFR-AT-0126]